MSELDDEPPLPFVRVVVLNWNSAWFTSRCLRSLLVTEYPQDRLEIVVVDNASIDGSAERLATDFAGIEIRRNPDNLGFAEGCNRAMRDLSPPAHDGPPVDFVALVNNDAVVEPGWLQPLIDAMAADGSVGAACPKILLETPFRDVELIPHDRGSQLSPPVVERVTVGGIDVTRRCLVDDLAVRVEGVRPLELVREVRRPSVIRVPVPASGDSLAIVFTVVEPGSGLTVRTSRDEATVSGAGVQVAEVTEAPGGTRRVNSLGTSLTPLEHGIEGFEVGFGMDDAEAPTTPHEVRGWSGGGVLLRSTMLKEVGLFDPRFFAYYEDTDLAWRARRRGWRTVCVPESVVHHLHGGTAGSTARPFFFLNYRNWQITVARNGDRQEIRAARQHATAMTRRAFRTNVFGRVRRFQRPDLALTAAWLRVWLGVCSLLPSIWRSRFSEFTVPSRLNRRFSAGRTDDAGHLIGSADTVAVRSRWMPASSPRPPSHRPGGPLIVYVDVTETLRSGWRAGIQRVTAEIVRHLPSQCPDIELVPVAWSRLHRGFRRITSDEYRSMLEPTTRQTPPRPVPPQPQWRQFVGAVGRRLGLQPLAERARRRRELAAESPECRELLLERFEAGSVFLDLDATWNVHDCPRSVLLARLAADGVLPAQVLYDIFPMLEPTWFERNSARRFVAHVDAHAEHSTLVLAISEHTASTYRAWLAQAGRPAPEVVVVPLGTELPISVDRGHAPDPLANLPAGLIDAPFVLAVGTIEPRKNHQALLSAYAQVRETHPELQLVVVGREGWESTDTMDQLQRLTSSDPNVHWLPRASDAELAELYRRAFVVVVPSFAEGFGLPVAEAIGHGCAVVSSSGGALREAGGDAAEYFDPKEPDELAVLLRRHLDEPLHHEARRNVAAETEPRRWADAAAAVGTAVLDHARTMTR